MTDFLIELLLCLPAVLIALTVHECAHGFVAYELGDPTAKQMGRLSLNPLKHIDPIGAVCMLIFHFGWAKPVPVDSLQFKSPKKGMAITALAGPMSNLFLASIGGFIYALTLKLLPEYFAEQNFWYWIAYAWVNIVYYSIWLNISLAIFNLIPIPPLDGSRILFAFLRKGCCQIHKALLLSGNCDVKKPSPYRSRLCYRHQRQRSCDSCAGRFREHQHRIQHTPS